MTAPALTAELAAFVAGITPQSIPSEALEVVRLGFTDCCASLLAGLPEAATKTVAAMARTNGGRTESRVLFGTERLPAPEAALVNATCAHALDYDDYAFSNHPSAVLVPAILALADSTGASGARMAAAYVAGYETWAELYLRETDHYHAKGWHPTATFGPVAAAAAAAVVLGLDAERTRNALAIAGSFAGGLMENFGTGVKPLHAGRGAQSGVIAARLAQAGMDASPVALEGERGLMRALSPKGSVDLERPMAAGREWRILKWRLNIKKYPTVGASQRTIDSLLALRATNTIEVAKIRTIVPLISARQAAQMNFHAPETALEAKFSLEFAAACALLHGKVGLSELTDAVVTSAPIKALIARTTLDRVTETDPGYPGAAPADYVTITLDDGSTLVSPPVKRASGHADAPLSREGLWTKFADCARAGAVAEPRARAFFDCMQRIDSLTSSADIPTL